MPDTHWRTLRIATYNIHRCRGLDGRTNPARIAEVIRTIEPDVIALQEVIGAGASSQGHAEELGALLGMGWVMAPTRHLRGALFGNVVLSRHPISHHAQYDLSWKTCEARCCQRVDIAFGDDTLHLYNVHLGTAFLERRYQAGRLSAIVHDRRTGQPKWFEMSKRIEDLMIREKKINANVDFYSASAYYVLGIPIDLFTPVFAVSRIAGWTAHILEQLADNKLIRPESDYVGPRNVRYVPIAERG